MSMRSLQAVIFDCDGVLVDSETLSCSAWLPVLARHGLDLELSDIQAFIGKSDQAVVDFAQQRLGRLLPADIIDQREAEYKAMATSRLATFPGLPQALDAIADLGLHLAVASSGRPDKIRFSLQHVGLGDRFGVVCSATEVANGKPAPDLFLLAAQRLGIAPERCCVVEDSVFGVQGARRAGMATLGFTSSYPGATLADAGATVTFDAYSGFMAALVQVDDGRS